LLLDFLSAGPEVDFFFAAFGREVGINEHDVCPSCFEPARGLRLTFPGFGAAPRRIVRCAHCADSVHVPHTWKLAVDLSKLSDRVVVVSGIPEGARARAYFVSVAASIGPMRTHVHSAHVLGPPQGGLLSFRMPEQLPAVPLFCRVLVAHCLKIGSISFKLRQLSDGSLSTPRQI
jgi:hypothetical protein